MGAALDASVIEIWTDVDGVLSANPKAVPRAFVLPQITYEEAMELSYFGAQGAAFRFHRARRDQAHSDSDQEYVQSRSTGHSDFARQRR